MHASRLLVAAGIAAIASLSASLASAQTFAGNGATGFGGPIGNGSIVVSDAGANVNFSFTPGTSFSGNALILYVDSIAGGVGSTSSLTDVSDPGRTAISGLSTAGRTLAVFPVGFGADYAVTLEPGVFGGTFDLSNPAAFPFVQSNGLSGAGVGPFTFSIAKANIGLPISGGSFSFVGSLISTSAYRSNETFGTSVTVPGSVGDTPNAGFTGTTTFALADRVVVPEPNTLGLLGGIAIAALRRRK